MNKKHIAIIGGGMTGLTAAYYLQKEIRNQQLPYEITLIEANYQLGGKIQTVRKDGFVIERGPDSFLARKISMSRLAQEVGMADQLVNNATGTSYVLVNEQLHPIPEGAVLGIPTHITPFVTSGLFSMTGKFRAALDVVIPRSKATGDQSLGQFFRRRLGNEVVENLIEPLLSGIYAGDIDQLSLQSTFPQFYEVEKKHRSLILGMKKTMPKPRSKGKEKKGIFLTFKNGLQSFVEAIEQHLTDVNVKKGIKVTNVKKDGNTYQIELNNGEVLQADGVVITVPHVALTTLLPELEAVQEFKHMPSTSVATVAMAFPKEAIKKQLDGTGFVVSRNSDYTITACTWTHKKWPHTTPDGKVLLRCYVGRAGDEAVVDLSDEDITQIVLDDLKRTMDLTAKPLFTIVTRWKQAMPQYVVGHQKRVEKLKQQLRQQLPGVIIAGSSFEGIGLPDCIDQGEKAVQEMLAYLKS
ncbi:protoporphyrinogen oxidase [Aeribacillus pallidus]|uniref:protoporphyrinogen oxidase n=1 Tax=Aeribacillus pallidus TaxID=33936 RepID=UPI003D1C4B7A